MRIPQVFADFLFIATAEPSPSSARVSAEVDAVEHEAEIWSEVKTFPGIFLATQDWKGKLLLRLYSPVHIGYHDRF